jgi:Na+/proline symporter
MSLLLVTALFGVGLVLLYKRRSPSDGALAGSLLTIAGTLLLGAVLSGDSETVLGTSSAAFYGPLSLGAALAAGGACLTFAFVRQHRQERAVITERLADVERA